jgi:hypothetical protein
MTRLPFTIFLCLSLILLTTSCSDSGQENTEPAAPESAQSQGDLGDYSHGIVVKNMRFLWKLQGDSIDIKVVGKTKGWVGIGLNPEAPESMTGGNFIIGYVKGGKPEAFDHYGTAKGKHKDDQKLGGEANLTNLSGTEQNGNTELAFTIPLDSGDAKDKPLNPEGDTTVFLAYGRSDSVALKHRFFAALTVNLSTGKYDILKVK